MSTAFSSKHLLDVFIIGTSLIYQKVVTTIFEIFSVCLVLVFDLRRCCYNFHKETRFNLK